MLPCPVQAMLEQILADKLLTTHRESDSDYYLFGNEWTEGCESVNFGAKTLERSSSRKGNVFVIEGLEFDSLKNRANMKVLLVGDNLLIDAWFLRQEKGWKLEKLTFIET